MNAAVAGAPGRWRRRVALVGGVFQVVFGACWLARGVAALGMPGVGAGLGLVALAGGLVAAGSLRTHGARPQGAANRQIERRLTLATGLQLGASVALPVIFDLGGAGRLSLPAVVASIGVLLVWLWWDVAAVYAGSAGVGLVVLAVVAVGFTGSRQAAFLGLGTAAVLLSCAWAGFGWLRAQGAVPDGRPVTARVVPASRSPR